MNEIDDCLWLHEVLESLPLISYPFDKNSLPDNGIYFFYEKGELSGHSGNKSRIVRVGTHKDGNFRSRINEHFLPKGIRLSKGKPCPKDRSIFRKNLGRAILNKLCPEYLPVWEIDFIKSENLKKYSNKRNIELEIQIEEEITERLRKDFSFRYIEVTDQKARMGKDGLESRLIGTLSHCSLCKPSKQWLGKSSPKEAIQRSGLWLVQHLNSNGITKEDKDYVNSLIGHNKKSLAYPENLLASEKPHKPFGFYITDEDYYFLKEKSKQTGKSISAIIREYIADDIKKKQILHSTQNDKFLDSRLRGNDRRGEK